MKYYCLMSENASAKPKKIKRSALLNTFEELNCALTLPFFL